MMIYGTTLQAGQGYQPGTAARRELDGLLSRIYEPVTREWLARQLPEVQEGRNRNAVQFLQADPFSWETTQTFNFVYTRFWAGSWTAQAEPLQTIRRKLNPGGVLLAEVVPLSGYQAYPYNHALARTMELIGLLEASLSGTVSEPEHIQVLLQPAGFELCELNTGLPAFLPRTDNRVVSLALEACRCALLNCGGSTAEELNALLLELKEFEPQDDTLISRPGLLQLAARPTGPNRTAICKTSSDTIETHPRGMS